LLQAVARLVAIKRLGVLLFVLLAALCTANTASAHERTQTKTRVRNFELAEHHSHGLSAPAKQRKASGKSRYWCPNSRPIHSYRWRDPSGRFLDGGAAEAGEAALAALEEAGPVGEVAAGWAVLPVAIVGYAGYNIYNQLDDFYHPIISHAENNQGKPNPGEPCKTEAGGAGAKGPPGSPPTAAPAAGPPRYNGKKPSYGVNPAHDARSPLYNPNKTPLPADAESVFRRAVPDDPVSPRNWFGENSDGEIYRFSNTGDGSVHFSGREGWGPGLRNITDYALDRLGR
jgi:hypothetical protein